MDREIINRIVKESVDAVLKEERDMKSVEEIARRYGGVGVLNIVKEALGEKAYDQVWYYMVTKYEQMMGY